MINHPTLLPNNIFVITVTIKRDPHVYSPITKNTGSFLGWVTYDKSSYSSPGKYTNREKINDHKTERRLEWN